MSINKNSFNTALFNQIPVVGILRDVSMEDADQILPLYIEAGFTTMEIPINCDNAERLIRAIVSRFGDKLNVGAGSVIDVSDMEKALDAGACFIVTPVVDEEVIRRCVAEDIPVFPGAFSPTEIVKAWKLGATMVKVFPAEELGLGYIKAMKAPLKSIQLLPTGGVSIENVQSYFQAGAQGVGVSTGLFKFELIRNKDWSRLQDHFVSFYQMVQTR